MTLNLKRPESKEIACASKINYERLKIELECNDLSGKNHKKLCRQFIKSIIEKRLVGDLEEIVYEKELRMSLTGSPFSVVISMDDPSRKVHYEHNGYIHLVHAIMDACGTNEKELKQKWANARSNVEVTNVLPKKAKANNKIELIDDSNCCMGDTTIVDMHQQNYSRYEPAMPRRWISFIEEKNGKKIDNSFMPDEEEEKLFIDYINNDLLMSLDEPRRGDIVKCSVVQVFSDQIFVNLGCKKDGIISKEEAFAENERKLTEVFAEGDIVQAMVLKADDGNGNIILSIRKCLMSRIWEELSTFLNSEERVNVSIIREVNGGVLVSYKGLLGLLPIGSNQDHSKIDRKYRKGNIISVRVVCVDMANNKLVFAEGENSGEVIVSTSNERNISYYKGLINKVLSGHVGKVEFYNETAHAGKIYYKAYCALDEKDRRALESIVKIGRYEAGITKKSNLEEIEKLKKSLVFVNGRYTLTNQ